MTEQNIITEYPTAPDKDARTTMLFACMECGFHAVIPSRNLPEDTTWLGQRCEECEHDQLVSVDGKCRHGRTVGPIEADTEVCWNDADEVLKHNSKTLALESQLPLCEAHYSIYVQQLSGAME